MREEEVRKMVRKGYAEVAKKTSCCCGEPETSERIGYTNRIGYTKRELESVPEGADMSLGCGNPVALASLQNDETVIDLGSGGGLDCFLAAGKVGENGKVIGVDMTPEMIDKARQNLRKSKHKNVEFRLGEIENLPAADNTADVVISNCVINLSPNKERVFKEAFRVLKPGGRLMVSDIVLLGELPEKVKKNAQAYLGCVAGAVMKDKYLKTVKNAGFKDVDVMDEKHMPVEIVTEDPSTREIIKKVKLKPEEAKSLANQIASITVCAVKPK
jgi:SAM-dependent methyltransferase